MEEKVVSIIPNVNKPKSFGRSDTYSLVITDSRIIFALLTSQMLQDAAKEAQDKGKAEGKGFFARWGAQMGTGLMYHERYWQMNPAEILAQNQGNFAIDNAMVRTIKIKRRTSSDDDSRDTTELKVESASANLTLQMNGHDQNTANVLRQVFGDRVKT